MATRIFLKREGFTVISLSSYDSKGTYHALHDLTEKVLYWNRYDSLYIQ